MTATATVPVPARFTRFAAWLAAASPWRVLLLAAAVRAATTGVHTTPNVAQWLLFAGDPYGPAPIDPAAHFITGSPLGPLLAHAVGADTELPYALVHLALVALSACALVGLGRRVAGDRLTNALVVLLFASPLSNVVLTWLGQPDAAMLGALAVLGLASGLPTGRAAAAAVAAGAVAGFASFEQGLAAVVALALCCWVTGDRDDRLVVVAGATGLLAGRLGVAAFHAASDVPTMSRSAWARSLGPGVFIRTFLYNLPALVFSMLGAGWLLAGHAAASLRATVGSVARLAAPAVVALAVALVALDQTRVSALVLWPAAIRLVRRADAERPGGLDGRLVALTAVLGLVLPPVVIWEGSPYISSWQVIWRGP